MKTRTDFVTNSSSSSFILAFKDKQDGEERIKSLLNNYGESYVTRLLMDFSEQTPINKEDLAAAIDDDIENSADYFLSFGDDDWWSMDKKTFENLWRKAHPNAPYGAYAASAEYIEALKAKKTEYLEEIMDKVGSQDYIVMVEYEDHEDVGCELEHRILPACDFTVRRFSHH